MKKLLIFSAILFIVGCSTSKKELYEKTDFFVESLHSTYDSYGILNFQENTKTTSDGLYKITPFGRLIDVRIEKYTNSDDYEKLKQDLEEHYKNNVWVNKVYICEGGTIIIDCRN